MEEQTTSRTLFVRNLPYTCTNEKLESLFGDIGPIKRCFVVKNKGRLHYLVYVLQMITNCFIAHSHVSWFHRLLIHSYVFKSEGHRFYINRCRSSA